MDGPPYRTPRDRFNGAQPMTRRVIAELIILTLALDIASTASRGQQALPVWEPDPQLAPKLADRSTFEGWSIQAPREFQHKVVKDPKETRFTWARQGGGLVVIWTTFPAKVSLEESLANYVELLRGRTQNMVNTPPERGQIGGRLFLRTRFSADRLPGVTGTGYGFVYISGDAKSPVALTGFGTSETIQLVEASALTFRLRGAGPEVSGPPWTLDPNAGKLLASARTVKGNSRFEFRPPKGYTRSDLEVTGGAPVSGERWSSLRRSDGTQHTLLVVIGKRAPDDANFEHHELISNFLKSREKSVGPMQISKVEFGKVQGVDFARASWTAQHATTGMKYRGIVYVTDSAPYDIILDSQDVEPYAETTLKLAEASALTFKINKDAR
jgi:hypothetical protein